MRAAFKTANETERGSLKKEIDRLAREVVDMQKRAGRPSYAATNERDEKSEHRKAFDRFLRGDTSAAMELRAAQVGVDADGGYAVPEDLNRTLLQLETNAVPMRQVAKVETAQNESKEQIVSLGGAAGGRVGETSARPDTTTPQLASVKPIFVEYYAQPKATQKMLDDAFFDAGAWLTEEVSKTFADYENTDFTTGDGVGKPKGFLSYTLSATPSFGQLKQIKSGAAGQITADKLIEVANEALLPGYLPGASWMMPRSLLRQIRQLKDGNGRYLFDPESRELLGHPIVLNDAMPAPGAASKSLAFGDFKRGYWITDVRGVRVLVDPYTDKPYVRYYVTKRTGGGVLDSQALCVVTLEV